MSLFDNGLMKILKKLFLFVVISLAFFYSNSLASVSEQEASKALKLSNDAIGKEVGDYTLIDQDGKNFSLREFAVGKPLVISFIYTSCGHICPTITANLGNAIQEADKDFGDKFSVITIGFDVENDTPQRMKEYGANFTADVKNWRFVTADRETIERLTNNLGFYYKKIEGGFDHLNFLTIVDSKGKIYEHVYGIDFKPRDVLQPVSEAIYKTAEQKEIKIGGFIDRLKLFCYKYDNATGTYKLDYPFIVKMVLESMTILIIILFIWGRDISVLFQRRFGH
ncbi:MAG: hypothetical protein A2067_06740 [Deltaproteobacteria bacterium GWB2_42_7]|nr:MAG: hypothetical protein A2067_06740 [Deltaproteobacteria bacterium GWB2_42_7]